MPSRADHTVMKPGRSGLCPAPISSRCVCLSVGPYVLVVPSGADHAVMKPGSKGPGPAIGWQSVVTCSLWSVGPGGALWGRPHCCETWKQGPWPSKCWQSLCLPVCQSVCLGGAPGSRTHCHKTWKLGPWPSPHWQPVCLPVCHTVSQYVWAVPSGTVPSGTDCST